MKKRLVCLCGWLFLGLGVIGIPLPVLPTTPFVIAAAACFSAGNPAVCRRLESSPLFGPYIENWRTKQGIPLAAKVKAILMLWFFMILSAWIVKRVWLTVLLIVTGLSVTLHLLLIKTKKSGKKCDRD